MLEIANHMIQNGDTALLLWLTFSAGLILGGIIGVAWGSLFK